MTTSATVVGRGSSLSTIEIINESAEPNGLDSPELGATDIQPDEPIRKTSRKAVFWLLVILAYSSMCQGKFCRDAEVINLARRETSVRPWQAWRPTDMVASSSTRGSVSVCLNDVISVNQA